MLERVRNNQSPHCWWECNMVQPVWKTVQQFLTELNIYRPYESVITLLCIYLREMKSEVHTKTHKQMFTVLFVIDQNWKQHKDLNKWMGKLVVVYHHHGILPRNKRNTLLTHVTTWMNLLNNYTELKKLDQRKYILCDSNYTKFYKMHTDL